MPERRGLSRHLQMQDCRYRIGSQENAARLLNISWGGARLGDVGEVPEVGAQVSLILKTGETETVLNGRVSNTSRMSFGIKFEESRGSVMRKLQPWL